MRKVIRSHSTSTHDDLIIDNRSTKYEFPDFFLHTLADFLHRQNRARSDLVDFMKYFSADFSPCENLRIFFTYLGAFLAIDNIVYNTVRLLFYVSEQTDKFCAMYVLKK
jgi:hypothetical protein